MDPDPVTVGSRQTLPNVAATAPAKPAGSKQVAVDVPMQGPALHPTNGMTPVGDAVSVNATVNGGSTQPNVAPALQLMPAGFEVTDPGPTTVTETPATAAKLAVALTPTPLGVVTRQVLLVPLQTPLHPLN